MLDPAFLRDNLEAVRSGLRRRGVDLSAELDELATLETQRRRLLPEIEGQPAYRIKNFSEEHERVAQESELSAL